MTDPAQIPPRDGPAPESTRTLQFELDESDYVDWWMAAMGRPGFQRSWRTYKQQTSALALAALAMTIVGVLGLTGYASVRLLSYMILAAALGLWGFTIHRLDKGSSDALESKIRGMAADESVQRLLGTYRIDLTANHLGITSPMRRIEHAWSDVVHIRREGTDVILTTASAGEYYIPARAFATDNDRLAFIDEIQRARSATLIGPDAHGHCPTCNYDLTGLPTNDSGAPTCPECGT